MKTLFALLAAGLIGFGIARVQEKPAPIPPQVVSLHQIETPRPSTPTPVPAKPGAWMFAEGERTALDKRPDLPKKTVSGKVRFYATPKPRSVSRDGYGNAWPK